MSSEPFDAAGRDPFGSTTAAQAYVPRPACERVLDELLAAVRRGAPCIALVGPNGIGKTQLVRVLAERLSDEAELLLLPYAAVDFADLCHWVLGLLGEAQGPFSDPGGALLEAAATRAAAGRRLILALDDASGLPIETARKLSALIQQAEGELQLVVIPVDDPRAGRVLAALGSEVALVRFNTPMSAEETLHYVRERLRASEATPALRDRFAEPVIAWLHRESGGLPRELHILAVKFLRDRPEANRDRLARSEEWLEIDTHETDAHELDAHEEEEEAAPLAEAELLGPEAEPPATPTAPDPATEPTPTPEVEPPAPQAAAPRAASDDPSWLRSHLPLVIGLALVAVGVFFALRGGPPPAITAAWPPVAKQPSPARAPVPSPPARPVAPVPDEPTTEIVELPDEPTTETPAAIPEQTPVAEAAAPLAAATPTPALVSDDVMPTEAPAEPPVVTEPEAPAQPAEIDIEIAVEEPPSTPDAPPAAPPEAAAEAKLEEVAPTEPEPAPPTPSPKRTEPASAPTPSPVRRVTRPAPPAPAPKLLPVAATGPPVSVRVDADPPARILIDGRDHGSTPLVDLPLASGRHRFEIIFPDGTRLLREKLIDANHREFRFSQPPRDQ